MDDPFTFDDGDIEDAVYAPPDERERRFYLYSIGIFIYLVSQILSMSWILYNPIYMRIGRNARLTTHVMWQPAKKTM